MKASELRIGNLVHLINRGYEAHLPGSIPFKVWQIGIFNSEILRADLNPAQIEQWVKVPNSDLSPIPLTKDWLLRFETKRDGNVYYKIGAEAFFINSDDDKVIWVRSRDDDSYLVIEFVHQLQNLHFALTGQELERKKSMQNG